MRKTSRRRFMKRTMIAGAAMAAGPAKELDATGEKKTPAAAKGGRLAGAPNLVFVFADQLGRNHVGYAGAAKARTPNIDKLAGQSVNLVNAVSNTPVCAAYRASLFTGKYTTTTGMVINELRMNPNHECIGHVLTQAGYQTGYVGKWHLWANKLGNHADVENSYTPPGPHRLGFDGYWAAYNFHHDYYNGWYHTQGKKKLTYGEGRTYEPTGQTDQAMRFVSRSAGGKRPFALFLSWGPPHDPWHAGNVPERFRKMFERTSLPNPPNYKPRSDRHTDAWGRLSPDQRKALESWRRIYYAMTSSIDHELGRLMGHLDKLGIADETILVFTSDHGEMFGAHGRRAKNIFYEEAARVPLLVRWPKRIKAGSTCDACISTVDLMPTMLSLMELPIPEKVEGMDLAGCVLGKPGAEPEAAFLQNTGACADWKDGFEWRAMRDKRYTYAIHRRGRQELLFDNVADPYQMKDLAGRIELRATLGRFRKMMKAKMTDLNDRFAECTWYRDNWTRDRVILRGAKG